MLHFSLNLHLLCLYYVHGVFLDLVVKRKQMVIVIINTENWDGKQKHFGGSFTWT